MSGNNSSNTSFGSAKNGGNPSNGSNGDKVIVGGGGDDRLNGGSGNDTLDGGAGDDRLNGGSGDDRLTGGSGQDDIDGGSGNDTIDGGVGNDDLRGGSGNDVVDGGAGHDEIDGGSGNDVIDGGAGWDRVGAGAGDDVAIYNFAENRGFNFDIYDGGSGTDTLRLEFTREEWMRADVQADVKRFLSYLSLYNSNSAGRGRCDDDDIDNDRDDDGSGFFPFLFRSTGLLAADFEKLEVVVDGVRLDARDEAVVLAADAINTTEDAASIAIDLLANDSVPDLIAGVTVTQPAHGTVTLTLALTDPLAPATAQAVYTPNSTYFQHLAVGQSATDSFTYTVTDADGDVATQTVMVTVTGTNDAPVAVADAAAGNENEVVTVDVLANDSDVDDGHVFTLVSAAALAAKGVASIFENRLVFTPGTDFDHLAAGAEEIVVVAYTMRDEHGAQSSATAAIRVTGTNDGPVAVADAGAGTENETLVVDVLANDNDVDDGHAFTLVSAEAPAGKGAASVAQNQLVFTPGGDFDHLAQGAQETVNVSYLMRDEHGAESSSVLTILVTGTNDGPVAVADAGAGTENETLIVDVLANDTDVDDGHAFTLVSADAPAGKGAASVAENQLVFTPGSDFDHLAQGAEETVTVTYLMQDEHGAQSSSTLTITVTGTNDGPVAVADTAEGSENQALIVDVLGNDSDVDHGHAFTLVAAEAPAGKGTASVVGNQLAFTPGTAFDHLAQGAQETVLVTYLMQDEHGAQSSAVLTITVTGTNDGPVAVADSGAGTENQVRTLNVLANDTDVDDAAAFTLLSASAPAGKGVASVAGNQLVFNPGADFDHLKQGATETVTLSYTMRDQHGAESTSTVAYTVAGVNDAPVVSGPVTGTATEDGSVSTLSAIANASDVDDGTVLNVANVGALPAGVTYNAATKSFTLDPGHATFQSLALGATRTVSVAYAVSDGITTVPATVSWVVTGVNDGPVAVSDALTTLEYVGSYRVSDGVNWSTNPPVYSAAEAAAKLFGGTASDYQISINASRDPSTITHTGWYDGWGKPWTVFNEDFKQDAPPAGYYQPFGDAWSALVADHVDYSKVNYVWRGEGGAYTSENNGFNLAPAKLLANDTDIDAGDVLTIITVSSVSAQNGSVVLNGDGTISYDPGTALDHLKQGATVTDSFSYTISDSKGGTSSATVTFTVEGRNDAPVVTGPLAISATEDGPGSTLNALANASDVDDGTVLNVVNIGALPAGVTYNAATKSFTLDPSHGAYQSLAAGQQTVVTVAYAVSDGIAPPIATSASWTITGVNDAPVAVADTATGAENQTVSINVLANDTDVDSGAVKTLVSGTAPDGKGSVSVSGNQLVFNPGTDFDHLAPGESEIVSLSYTMRDQHGAQPSSTVSYTVTGTNDVPRLDLDVPAPTTNPTAINELFKLNGSATQVSANLLQLTPDATSLSGSAFSLKKLDLSQSMTFDFDIFVGHHDVPGADGVAMVLHNDPRGATATGGFGIGLGVAGIQNGLAIEFDTYSNAGEPVQDHTSIMRTSNFTSVTPVQTLGNIEDGQFHRVVVSWNAATQTLSYTIDGIARGTLTGDLATQYFGGSQTVFFGFTGGTGGEGNLQQVRINSITGVLADAAPGYPTYTENGAPIAIAGGNVDADDWGERDLTTLTVTVGGLRDGGSEQLTIGSATAQLNTSQSGSVTVAGEAFNYAYNAGAGTFTVTAVDGRIDPSALEALIGSMTYADLGEAPTAGTRSFAFAITDASGGSSPVQTARIDVVPVNDAPVVAGPVTGTATEDGAVSTLSALANSSDVDSALTVVNVPATLPAGVSYNAAARTFTLDPSNAAYQPLAAGQTTTVTINYGVTDGTVTVPTSASWTVTGANDAPSAIVLSNASILESATAGTVVGVLTGTDPDTGTTLTYSAVGGRTDLFEVVGNELRLKEGAEIDHEAVPSHSLSVRVSDQFSASFDRTFTIDVADANEAPAWNLAVNGDFERGPFVNNGAGWMPLGNGSATIPGWTVTGSGGVDWHIADDTQGRLFLDLAGSGPGGVTQTLATVAGGLYRVDFDLAANPAFASTETIVVSAASASQSFSFDAAGRSLQNMGWQATSMTFTATAPSTALNFASASPNDSVGPALDNVRATLIGFAPIEDTALSSSVRAVDPDGDALTYGLVSGTTHGSLTLNANGSFTYTPDANYNGADSFQVKASDGAASAVQTFSIGVAAANDAPTIVPAGAMFDGSAHVGIAGPAIFTGAGGYSYEVTFKTSSTGIFQTLLSVGVFTTNKASEFVIGPDGKLNFGVNNAHVSVITSAGSVADGQWHTATATYNGSGQLALYLDGSLVGTSSYAGVSLTGGVAMIGAANTDIRNHFVGEIAEAHVWNRGLSAAEATNQSTPSPTDPGLIGSYLLSSGGTANAASGLPDGTNVGVTFSVSGGVSEIAEGAAGEGSAISSTSGAILFKDIDAGDSHGAAFTPNGAGYLGSFAVTVDQALDRANWQFTVADSAIEHLAAGQVLTQSYTVTVTDAAGAPASQIVTMTIAGTNDAPVVANAIPDRSVNEDTAWAYTVAGNAFSDVDSASLTYAARSLGGGALPAWLSFDAATRTFSGTPPTNFNGTVALQVTASDGSLSVTDAFNLNVTPVNDAPVLANAIPDRTVNEDSAWSYTVAANTFTDVDNPALTYAASLAGGGVLPSWLSFNAATRTFTGTPPANFNGTVGLAVAASDGSFSVSDSFILSVLPVADMPTLSVGSSTVLQPTVGAAAAYTASLTAGQAFTFNWNFVAGDYLPYNDFAFVSVNGVVTSLALVEVVGDYGGTGWRTYSFTAPTSGSYTFGIGVANDRDTSFISDLLVDNVRVGGVSVASFESSISPFAISGTVTRASTFSTTNAPVVQSPTDGAFMLRINGTPTSAAALETFMGAPAGSLALAATPTGHAGKPITVPVNVTAPPGDLQDTYILIKGMPAGATFSLGSYDAALGGWKVDASALGGNLTMTTSATGNHTLTVTATSFASETNTTQTTAAKSVSITVLAGSGSDPLVFDLGGDGVSFLTADAGVTFDLDGDGEAEATGWLTAGDGLLVLDLDGSGAIEDGTEVLSETFLGLDFANSLDALRFLDDNEDGVIDAGDEAYSTLRLWADADSDGASDASELHGFADLGIVSISLSATDLDATQDRQDLLGSAAFSFEDGAVGTYYIVQLNQPALVPVGEVLG